MDSRPTTAESKHNYIHNHWGRLSSKAVSSSPATGSTSRPETSALPFPSHLDLLPILFPQQSLFQAQLLQYNQLISGRAGGVVLQTTPPHAPLVTAPTHLGSKSRSRSSSKVSNKDQVPPPPAKQSGVQSCHGNRGAKTPEKADRALITPAKNGSPKMTSKKGANGEGSQALPSRSTGSANQQNLHGPALSSSVPSTPHQHARNFSESREPSPTSNQNHSPRSAYSETNSTLPSLRPLPPKYGGCRYETALVRGRRRMPYSMGSDRLEKVDKEKIKSKLSKEEERKLTTDMRELYDRIKPTKKVDENRKKLVKKLKKIFNDEWPGHNIEVHLFGSSGNLLCSDDSDVDICITTEWKVMEDVCMIAALLAKRGMERVVCVASAKVPIVKIWDPDLGLACDMNVNNTLALENTRMVRTYVEIDDRVKLLAMTLKYWTRRRIINDAAFGGTLSSYTWICMIICFLQLRDPPVLPSLHQRPHHRLPPKNGRQSDFADDLDKLKGFGNKNKESTGELLFQFFRFYAHEFDYEKYALSVRLGKMITKTEKKWQLAVNNMLCVEEPFNTVRNLGNTADDTSFRGLHLELRRAFDLIAEGKLDECCEQYVFPPEEERIFQKPPSAPRPVLLRSSSQQHSGRGGRGSYRGGRHSNRSNNNNSRRASSSVAYDNNAAFTQTAIPQMTPQEAQWYQSQAAAQYSFSGDMLNSALNALQMQEHNLRFQLYTHSQHFAQQQALAHAQRMQGGAQSADRSRTNSFDQAPMSAPLRPELYYYAMPLQASPFIPGAFTTYPSSPSTPAAAPEFRRSLHRNTVANDSSISPGNGSLRSQSQPASRTSQSATQPIGSYSASNAVASGAPSFQSRSMGGVSIPSFIPPEDVDSELEEGPSKTFSESPDDEGPRYIGYYVNEASDPAKKSTAPLNGIPAFGDLGQGAQSSRRISTDQLPHSLLDRRIRRASRSPSPLGHTRAFSVGTSSAPLSSAPFTATGSKLAIESRPLVVNGSAPKLNINTASGRQASTSDGATSAGDIVYDNPLHNNQGSSVSGYPRELTPVPAASQTESGPSFAERPLVVNGSTGSTPAPAMQPTGMDFQSFGQRVAAMTGLSNVPYAGMTGEAFNGAHGTELTLSSRQRALARSLQSGIAPLDLAVADPSFVSDFRHLSPVYETLTPSPTLVRKFENPLHPDRVGSQNHAGPSLRKDSRAESGVKSKAKTTPGPSGGNPEQSSGQSYSSKTEGSTARENSHVRGARSESENPTGWQKSKSRKKEPRHATGGPSQSEQIPKSAEDRKGG